MTDKVVVLVTCGSVRKANQLARALVERQLAACVNVLRAPVRSTYRWKGKVEVATEHLLLVKSSRKCFRALRAEVERLHSYEVPEIVALPIAEGSAAYLDWLAECLGESPRGAPRQRRG